MSVWQEKLQESLKSKEQIEDFFGTSFPSSTFKPFIPLPVAKKIKDAGVDSALAKQYLPHPLENQLKGGLEDPIADSSKQVLPGLIHRYKNRVLLMPVESCPINCRYCFRRNEMRQGKDLFRPNIPVILNYISAHDEINEVILSGGDPLILSDEKLCQLLASLGKISTLKTIRFHTKYPIIDCSRITEDLLQSCKNLANLGKKVIFVVHTNHPAEWDQTLAQTIDKLKNNSVEVLSQSVLLKGVNDNVMTLKNLFKSLNHIGIRPYYLHQCDDVLGAQHFKVTPELTKEIYQELRNCLSGWMLPQLIIDSADGSGKKQL